MQKFPHLAANAETLAVAPWQVLKHKPKAVHAA